ncbi:hypothetical protein LXL04_029429 [Taraxacum kok-saghyz]
MATIFTSMINKFKEMIDKELTEFKKLDENGRAKLEGMIGNGPAVWDFGEFAAGERRGMEEASVYLWQTLPTTHHKKFASGKLPKK